MSKDPLLWEPIALRLAPDIFKDSNLDEIRKRYGVYAHTLYMPLLIISFSNPQEFKQVVQKVAQDRHKEKDDTESLPPIARAHYQAVFRQSE